MKLWITYLCSALFVSAISAKYNPLRDPSKCGNPTCDEEKEANEKFRYMVGTQHKYKYFVQANTLFQGTSKNESKLYIEATVQLEFLTKCDGLLKVSDVKLRDEAIVDAPRVEQNENEYEFEDEAEESGLHENSNLFSESLSEFPLRFEFQDGMISEVCSYDEEKQWVMNFKKGLLSMMHNTMRRFDLDYETVEEDIRGKCQTSYKILGTNETSLIVEKTKNLNTCIGRSKFHSMVQSTPYNFKVNNQEEGSLLRSRSRCELSIDHHIYNEINCEETHVFEPFAKKASGATTIVRQKLVLVSEEPETVDDQPEIESRFSLIYDHVPTPKPTSKELKTSRDLIKKLCQLSTEDVDMVFSDLFTKFIHTSRILSYPALSALYGHSATLCPTGKKHLLEALPYLGSNAAVALMTDVILKGGLPEETVREWLVHIALIPRPDASMMNSASQLLQSREDPSTVLGIAAITYTYCKQNENCRNDENVDAIIQKLEDRITETYNDRRSDRATEETMLVTLKAIANIGVTSEQFNEKLRDMIEDDTLQISIRVAAIDAHRRFDCVAIRSYFEQIFRNEVEDVEVRIASYLQVMRCPTYLVMRTIKHTLEHEEVNQVGSFVWSHLHNLLKSSIPSRVEIQGMLSDDDLTKKFSSDMRKFSHNFEGSVFFEDYNVGANYESNVIFSPSSYVPKSAMLNLTVDLFGESVNMFEVYGRMEGLEHYLESVFGHKGPLSTKKFRDYLPIPFPKMRWARDISNDEQLKSEIDTVQNANQKHHGEPKVSLGMKLFGNEIKYATFNGDEEIKQALADLNPADHLKRILSGKEINYSKSAMFLDSSYVVSSGAGLPVTLNAIGTTSINMQLRGSLKANNFLKTKELELIGNVKPSIAVDIVGSMSLDAYYASTGIKLKTNMYTSSAVEGHVKVKGAKLVSIKFGIPKRNIDIFAAKSELYVMKGNEEIQQEGQKDVYVTESACSWPAVEKTVGLQMCVDYHFSNVSQLNNASYFILAGPAGFRLSLQKTDPTATTYLLEYKWVEKPSGSYASITFDTPGSSARRVLSANLTIDSVSRNLTVQFQSTEGSALARGRYKNTEMEKYLQFALDINEENNFDLLVSLEKEEIRNGFMYHPRCYIAVTNERIADLEGTVKQITKSGISQYDVDLKFKTKRLNSKLYGYISRDDASVSSTLKFTYKFLNTKEHIVLTDFSLSNRSTKNIFIIHGDAKVTASAYPNYNFNSTFSLQRSGSHVESKFIINSSPHLLSNLNDDPEMLTVQLFLSYRTLTNGTRFKVSGAVSRHSTELDVKGQLSYDVIGYSTNAMVLARYNKGKDIVITVYWHHPRQTLETIDGRLNVTIPGFVPMVLEGKLKEKNSGDYAIDLSCTWFSGHSLSSTGLYQDRSTPLAANHHLKLVVRSPSFKDINAICHFYRNNTEIMIDIKADQQDELYALYWKHVQISKYEISTAGKVTYKSKLYSITSSVSLKEKRQIRLEVHIDQIRDIYVSMWIDNKEARKEAGLELKWDANRDPNQKLVVTVYYANPKPYNYEANFQVSYPGRNIKGLYLFVLNENHFLTLARVAWTPDDAFSVRFEVNYKNGADTMIMVQTELLTPFDDWKKTSLSGGYFQSENSYRLNGSMHWQQNQHISIDLFADYFAKDSVLRCEFTGSLDSTVRDISSLSASVKHSHNSTKVDSELYLMYQPKEKIALTSSWEILQDSHMKNLTGVVTLVSPFKGFNKGLLVSKLLVTNSRTLRGVANLDLDHREFTISVDGNFQRLTKNMLVFNVTTPIDKFKNIHGRIGLSEENRYLVAMVDYPSGKTGVEIRFQVVSFSDLDIKFNLATPIEFLQEVLIVAKLKPEMADFRIGWNYLVVGFSGVWHYTDVMNFEYAYKIFTPIDGFKENGIVAKIIYKEGLDLELSTKFAQNKLGIIILGKPKPKILKELGIKTQAIYKKKLNVFSGFGIKKKTDKVDDDEEHEEDPINWSGYIELNTLIYPTMTAEIDIDQKGTVYDVGANLKLPAGNAEFRNEFDYIDLLNMRNKLTLVTPYPWFKEITSNYELKISMDREYLVLLDLDYLNGTRWIKMGTLAHYIRPADQEDDTVYNVTFHVHTPFKAFPLLDLNGALTLEDNTYHTNFSMVTNSSDIAFVGDLELDDGSVEMEIGSHVITPVLQFPASKMSFKKYNSSAENRIECQYLMVNNRTNRFNLVAVWNYKTNTDLWVYVNMESPFKGLEKTEAAVELHAKDSRNVIARAKLVLFPIDLKANATIRDNDLRAVMFVDFSGSRHVMTLNGTTRDVGKGNRELTGVMAINDKKHNITALLGIENELPSNLQLEMTPHNGGSPLTLDYKLISGAESYIITSSVKQASNFMIFKGKATVRREYDWDMHLEIETSHQRYKTFIINSKAASSASNRSIAIDAKTPFERLENIQMGASLAQAQEEQEARGFYVLGDTDARLCARWTWLLFENMNVKLMGNYKRANEERTAAINAFYVNPNKTFNSVRVGGDADINNVWIMAGNLTFGRPGPNKVDLLANMQLPKPNSELHMVTGKFYGSKDLTDIEYLANYKTLKTAKNYGSSGHLKYHNERNMNADVLIDYYDKNVHNYVDIREKDDMVHLLYKLKTPKFQQEALIMKATYIKWMNYHNVTGELFYPGNSSVANGNLNFMEFANMNGFVNASTPIEGLNYTGVNFNTKTNPSTYNRYVNVFWPTNNALLDSKCITTEVDGSALSYRTVGLLLLEVPLATRHIARVDYEYNKKPLNSTGQATAVYNKDPIFEANYNCLSKSKAGFEKDTVHVEVQNKWLPVGADYIHSFEYNAPGDGTNMPTMDDKHINVYQLNNRSAFDVTGDLRIHTKNSGQEITVVAIHSNRTVKLITNYDILEQEFKQNSRMELGPTAWIAYELDILNKTNDATSEAQEIQMNLSYPRRNFTAVGSYNLSENTLSSEMALAWDKEHKTIQAGFDWRRDTTHSNRQTVLLGLKHPSFEKNVTILGEYAKTDRVLADVKMSIDYSVDPEKMVKLSAYVANNANQSMPWNYTYALWADHRATNLNLNVQGGIFHRPRWYYSRNLVDYKRTYLPVQSGEASVRLDLDKHEVELKRKTLHELSYLWGKYAGKYPLYTANMSAIHGEDIDAAGTYYLNFKEKLLLLEVNKTADASQSLHMHGYIPDARSAYFDIWRNFEDIRISDVSYFLLMNHSRLLVSSLQWRPELKQDLKDGIREISVGMYNYTMEKSDYWRQYIRSETGLAISGIWEDSKPQIQYFLNDVKDLVVIEQDLEELKVFLNNSYNANEFYIKDITNFMTYVIDELSIRSHIESLPAIVNEIWDVMGESGKKIQKGIVWVIEKIKSYYKNAAEFVNGIFQGDSLGHFSEALKELVEKYDTFIKDMHVAFIRYMEQLWKQTHKMILDNWHKTLVAIEPTFIKMIHYLETIAWNASKEFLDFIYIRKSEIVENPYYGMISNLTRDMGIFYKEMTGNDTIGATYKYSKVAWKFVKEKYFKLVPFGRELQDIIDEITNEVSELKNMPSIRYVLDRFNKIEERVKWFYDYFDVEGKIHRLITLIHLKVTDMKQTALQAENKYREAKTKFIFEPADGIMHLEQKLPMSWHAFNETPNFEEIPEYKTIADLQGYFTTSKMTFSNFYHDYKPFIDPSDWLPPFKAQAMLVGSQYYVTFDRQVYDFDGDCTYLLASDFLDRNFSIAVSYKDNKKVKTNELLVVIHDTVIRIDTFANSIQIGNDKTTRLPYQIGDVSLYQEAEIFKLESKMGFELQCNMKFNVCAFEVSGWYFGKTAGLWGTMNNEPFDDLSTPNNKILNDVQKFGQSWSLDQNCPTKKREVAVSSAARKQTQHLRTMCYSFFNSTVSPFSTCFHRVDNIPFYEMCLKSHNEEEACSSAIAYMKLCSYINTPLRIPDACVKCSMLNGSIVAEGEFVSLDAASVPQSADIVFIIEAKDCNKDVRQRKKLDEIVQQLNRELNVHGVRDNRYSVVLFGGDGVYNKPRSVVINSNVFTEHHFISSYFDHIPIGNGSLDIYAAISYSAKLIFRPGVSKTFVLLPCTSCQESNMKLDYAILHQLLLENDITLHILMNEEFQLKKTRVNKNLFGLDRTMAYTKKDADDLRGDATLRKSVQLPKSTLGYCTPLALETNGTVFSGKKLETEKLKSAKKIATVFAKRVARTAVPSTCKTCECTGHNTGVSFMECLPCTYPTPVTIDYGFDEDEMLSILQPGEDDLFDYTD